MNKSAEQEFEDYAKGKVVIMSQQYKDGFIAGHHSRDEEVKKLVEVLEELVIWNEKSFAECGLTMKGIAAKAKEALKPYNQKQ